MKKINLQVMLTGLFLLLTQFLAHAQNGNIPQPILSYNLNVTCDKTSNIIFPYAIIGVDLGSRDILAQKAKGVENILQVKAAREKFAETNLTVVTADGKLNSFIVNYDISPSLLNLTISGASPVRIKLSSDANNMGIVQKIAKQVFGSPVTGKTVHDDWDEVTLKLNGLFVHDDVIYFRLQIENTSNIGYDIDQLRFFISDQKKTKRTAVQQLEISPVYVENYGASIDAQRSRTMVLAIPKFTIPDQKHLIIQLVELNGGRHLELQIRNRALLKAKLIQP